MQQGLGRWLQRLARSDRTDRTDRSDAAPPAALPPAARSVARAAPRPERLPPSAQLERLRGAAHTDSDTGLPNRRQFVGRLGARLARPDGPGCALLIVRIADIATLHARAGADAADRAAAIVAEALATWSGQVGGAFAGRLADGDFGLCLPAPDLAEETAAALLRALRASPACAPGLAEIAIGGVDGLQGAHASALAEALAAADHALAQAEAAGPFALQVHGAAAAVADVPRGERAWRVRIEEALHEERVSLAEFPVVGPDLQLLYLECPLRVQLEVGGPFREAQRWLAMASRSRLLPQVDLTALELALVATARDGWPRGVHVGAASLAVPGFVGEVRRRLDAAPEAARLLWVAVAEGPHPERGATRLREAAAAWQRSGVRVGVEHAAGSAHALALLAGSGIDHVRIDARHLRGAGRDDAVAAFAAGVAELVHALDCRVHAEGIDDGDDLAALWRLGFDAATGPAVSLRR